MGRSEGLAKFYQTINKTIPEEIPVPPKLMDCKVANEIREKGTQAQIKKFEEFLATSEGLTEEVKEQYLGILAVLKRIKYCKDDCVFCETQWTRNSKDCIGCFLKDCIGYDEIKLWEEVNNKTYPQNICETFVINETEQITENARTHSKQDFSMIETLMTNGLRNQNDESKEMRDICTCSEDGCNFRNNPVGLTTTADSNTNTDSPEPPSDETTYPGTTKSPSDDKTSTGKSKSPSDDNVSNPSQIKTSPKDNPTDQASTATHANGGNHASYRFVNCHVAIFLSFLAFSFVN